MFCRWSFSLTGNISNLSPVQFKHLMGKAFEELLGPTEKLEILFPHYCRSLHIAATLQSPHSHDPKCSEPLFTPPPLLALFSASKLCSLLKESHPPFWGCFRDLGCFLSRGCFRSLRFYVCSFIPVRGGRQETEGVRGRDNLTGIPKYYRTMWYPHHSLQQTVSQVEHTFQQTSSLFITF